MSINNLNFIFLKSKKVIIFFIVAFFLFVFLPHFNIANDISRSFVFNHVNTDSENLVLYGYKVYGTEEVFYKNYSSYAEKEALKLKIKNETTVVKINGEKLKKIETNYLLIADNSVPELNAEIYIAKNVDIFSLSLPCKTILVLLKSILYYLIITIYCLVFLICFIKYAKNIVKKIKPKDFFKYKIFLR